PGVAHALRRLVLAQLERDPPKRRFAAHAFPHPLVVDKEPGQVHEPATGRLDATLRRELYEGGRPNGPLEVEVQMRFGQRAQVPHVRHYTYNGAAVDPRTISR